jgi:transposase
MEVFTREERRRRVLELHNQGKGTREIAEILDMSFRDIGVFLKGKEVEKEQEQQQFLSSQAYKLFLKVKVQYMRLLN